MPDNDEIVLEDAKEAAFKIDVEYRRAINSNDIAKVVELKPYVDQAYEAFSKARLNLLQEGVLATNDDVTEMHRIRAEIDQAATKQALVVGAAKLVSFMAKFAI